MIGATDGVLLGRLLGLEVTGFLLGLAVVGFIVGVVGQIVVHCCVPELQMAKGLQQSLFRRQPLPVLVKTH